MKHLKQYTDGVTFKEWVKYYSVDLNSTKINCNNSNLIDLDGIEEFIKVEFISCAHNNLTKIPDLSNLKNLEYLYCSNNKLTELPDLSGLERLDFLYCRNNYLPFKCNYINNLRDYMEWHKKEYPWFWDAKKYNL